MLDGLAKLGQGMRDNAPQSAGITNAVAAGYTYLGQFIDHDLTWDPSPIVKPATAPERIRNLRSPHLDLEVLYGSGPSVTPFLYDRSSRRGEEKLLLDKTLPKDPYEPSDDDLPRNGEGIALVPDPRQDENLVLAQLHVAFAQLHNKIVASSAVLDQSPHYRAAGSRFAAARRVLTWHYQWIARHDFLEQFIDKGVYRDLDDLQDRTDATSEHPFGIPVEFSHAAFRFGHSLVRDEYVYNTAHPVVKLRDDLAKQTGVGGGAVPNLGADWKIDWEQFFFLGDDTRTNRIRMIDTLVAKDLFDLPPDGSHLPVKSLQRGARVGLPSGQSIARHLNVEPLLPDVLASGMEPSLASLYHFDTETPLWYYILKEAEGPGLGKRLGPVGSRIVGRVIVAALQSDATSYLNVAPDWRPTLAGSAGKESFTMLDLLRFLRWNPRSATPGNNT